MAGALSSHLIDQYNPNSSFNSSIVSHGAMSYNPNMHGTPQAQQSFSLFGTQPSFANNPISEETVKKIATLQVKLNQKLGPEYISQRPGPGGGPKLTYVEGWKIINLANEVFGFHGWSSSIVSLTTDFADYSEESRRYSVGVTALMRVTLRDGVFHEDIGYGMLENSKSKGAALDKCKKEAVTDGLKRALRNFGNVLGNCLYDKSYTQEVIKIKYEPTKFSKDGLHRRPEFEDIKPDVSSASASTSNSNAPQSGYANDVNTVTPSRPPVQLNQTKPVGSIPSHIRSEMHHTPGSTSNSSSTMSHTTKGKGSTLPQPRQPTGLHTPITTPAHPPAQRSFPPQPPQSHLQRQNGQPVNQTVSLAQHPLPSVDKLPPQQVAQTKPEPFDDDDESFGFNSEDDAFLANVDLGPAIGAYESDMGRPILADIDMGQPIDHDEGLLQGPDEDNDEVLVVANPPAVVTGSAPNSNTKNNSGTAATKSRHELIAAALSSSAEGNHAAQVKPTVPHSGLASGMLSRHLPQQQQRASETIATGSSAASSSSSSMRPPPHPAQSRATSLVQQNHQRYINQKQNNQNQNIAPQMQQQTSSTISGNDSAKRASTPSAMGGFNFPPGMNPLQTAGRTVPSFSSGSGSGIGIKRPADAMSSNTPSSFRAGRPGMGLQQQSTGVPGQGSVAGSGANSNGRNVLGALDITDGGDVKRRRS